MVRCADVVEAVISKSSHAPLLEAARGKIWRIHFLLSLSSNHLLKHVR